MDNILQYMETRAAFIGTPYRRLDSRLFRLFRLLADCYRDSGLIDEEHSTLDLVSYDAEKRVYSLQEGGKALTLAPRGVRLVISEREDEEGNRFFTIVLSKPEFEYAFSGGARLSIRMSGDDDRLERLAEGCRELARINDRLPKLAAVTQARRDRALSSFKEDDSPEGRDNRAAFEAIGQLLEEEEQKREAQVKRIQSGNVRIAVIDTEMAQRHVIQFSGLILEQKEPGRFAVAGRKNIYLQLPDKVHIRPEIRNLTHISESMLAKKGLSRHYAAEKEILPFLESADIICGHAISNDIEALKADFPEVLSKRLEDCEVIDTQRMADVVFLLERNVSLEGCCELAKIPQEGEDGGFHDAMYDAMMTARLMLRLLNLYIGKTDTSPVMRMQDMAKLHGLINLSVMKEFSDDEEETGIPDRSELY